MVSLHWIFSDRMNFTTMLMKFMVSVMIILHVLTSTCSAQNDEKCLPPGHPCYQINKSCCPGYKCASGPLAGPPRPTDRCISDKIIG